jgi:hypothetical protein
MAVARAQIYPIAIPLPHPPESGYFKMGAARRPDGRELTVDSQSLRLDGKPWMPVMGEFHFSRYPAAEWRAELLKMKAGGVDIVSTYVFWIHHEEVQGAWDWSGSRDLRGFVQAAHEAGLAVIVRCGPWAHGEVRNGGFPDWVVNNKAWKPRSTDPKFLEATRGLYQQIAAQLKGLLWKDGGPVIGIQVDNEYRGPAAYLLALKGIAREVGLDVPLYTRTGWPALSTPMPLGELLPLYGAYAEGFWDRTAEPMPGDYWKEFTFRNLRASTAIATDQTGARVAQDEGDAAKYPYLACEIGGGMADSYHRRVFMPAKDVEAPALVQIGSGNVAPGYYMYHGGTNPDGKLSTLMEAQATALTNYNDLPVKTYDFQAPLGEYGQIRESYHRLRRLHLFLHDFGPALATMPAIFPKQAVAKKTDSDTLRWSTRSDGRSGYVFVNNYQRLQPMPTKVDVQFVMQLPGGDLLFPARSITIPADSTFFWPFNFDLGHGAKLSWATAQPLCAVDDGNVRTVFFAETAGVTAQFYFDQTARFEFDASTAHIAGGGDWRQVREVKPSRQVAFRLRAPQGGFVQIVLLSEADSLALWKGSWRGRDRVFLTSAGLVIDGEKLQLTSSEFPTVAVDIFPAPADVAAWTLPLAPKPDGVFQRYTLAVGSVPAIAVTLESVQEAGPPRTIHNGPIKQGVPQAPEDADFASAAVWRIKIPNGLDLARDPIVRIHYAGDVARLTLNGKLLTDDFYDGHALDLGLRRHAPEVLSGELRLAILPLRRDAPIYLAEAARPDFGGSDSVAAVSGVELVQSQTVTLTAR